MQIYYVRLKLSENDHKADWYNKRLPLWLLRKWWIQNQAVRTRFIYEGKFMGLELILPYTTEGLQRITKEELKEHIQDILLVLKCSSAVVLPDQELREYMGYHAIPVNACFLSVMLAETVEYTRKYRGIRKKNLHILLLDQEGDKTDQTYVPLPYLLDVLLPDLNRMTIATDRLEQIEPSLQRTYESTGLIIETMPRHAEWNPSSLASGRQEDVIWIDLTYMELGYYEQTIIQRTEKNAGMKWDLITLSDIQIIMEGNRIDSQLLCHFLMKRAAEDWCVQTVSQIKEEYQLTLGKISWKPKKSRIDNPL